MPIERPHPGIFPAQQVVLVHVVAPRAEIQTAMQAAIAEITTALKAQGVPPTGPWFAHHHCRPAETFDFDVCFPVARSVEATGRLENARLPEIPVIRTAYHGPYEGLPEAWPEFLEWVRDHGHPTREDAFEVYSIGPREFADPEGWQTDLICPLRESPQP